MTKHLDFNEQFRAAMEMLDAGHSVFITGKAGTGKSTLLRHFLDMTDREAVVAAPTGVAALNVGGQTIHRLFSFPSTVTPEMVASNDYFPRRSIKVLRSLEILVIDEVSMVRADLLDSVDAALRRFGPKPGAPFGGVQMVFVGDPYQLPPVVAESEEAHFRTRYATPFFFSADSLGALEYKTVELHTVYRQHDDEFIALLNAIRTGDATQADFDRLNERYLPTFEPPDDEFWVTLTTTNAMAAAVNDRKLNALATPMLTHAATSWGEVEDTDKSVPDVLHYKVGAQVMLVSNDQGDRWVNGSMGVISNSEVQGGETTVTVELLDGGKVEVGPHQWDVIRPVVADGKLAYDVVGSFRQLPFKPAWAVTIHKSQGKTLERAVVSLGRGTFADGQLYVALSRCTSLPGLVLKSEVKRHHVKVEREVTRFLSRSKGGHVMADGNAFIAALSTGMGRHDRVMEIGCIVERDGQIEEFSTLLNPMRDVGSAAGDYGLSASDLSLAPTFGEAWPWLARRLAGCVVVAHGLPLVQTMMERESEASGVRVDLGLGIDTRDWSKTDLTHAASGAGVVLPQQPTALDLARATRALYAAYGPVDTVTAPYVPGPEARIVGRMRSRNVTNSGRRYGGDPVPDYADAVASAIGQSVDEDETRDALGRQAAALGVSAEAVRDVHTDALEALVVAAARDEIITDEERAALAHAAHVLGLPIPEIAPPTSLRPPELESGWRVCFTGTAVDSSGVVLDRKELESLAQGAGLVPVGAVSKTRCDAVIAADPASMSGKAKKARELGKPVLSVDQFLHWHGEQAKVSG
ncbi:MAG: AAA family ATPase [Actinomycetota bacterium]|nr:AAA family ATPase [Actinomycetota bacterium]